MVTLDPMENRSMNGKNLSFSFSLISYIKICFSFKILQIIFFFFRDIPNKCFYFTSLEKFYATGYQYL